MKIDAVRLPAMFQSPVSPSFPQHTSFSYFGSLTDQIKKRQTKVCRFALSPPVSMFIKILFKCTFCRNNRQQHHNQLNRNNDK